MLHAYTARSHYISNLFDLQELFEKAVSGNLNIAQIKKAINGYIV